MPPKNKHFLDSSVARSMLLGSQRYKEYFSEYFGDDPLYISRYVQMELKRSYLLNVIYFYFVLRLPYIRTTDDAFRIWSNKFGKGELKAIIQLAAELFSAHRFNYTREGDKPKAVRELARYIMLIETKLRLRYKNIAKDSTHCARANIPFRVEPSDFAKGFEDFVARFDDTTTCRSKCTIDHFILTRYLSQVRNYVQEADSLTKKTGNEQFIGVTEGLRRILDNGPDACTCRLCGTIGDAVITLDAPRDMKIEHTDNSFDRLCDSVHQPHHKHPSEIKVVRGA